MSLGEKHGVPHPYSDTQVAHCHFTLYICNCKVKKYQQGALQEGSNHRESLRLSSSYLTGCWGWARADMEGLVPVSVAQHLKLCSLPC